MSRTCKTCGKEAYNDNGDVTWNCQCGLNAVPVILEGNKINSGQHGFGNCGCVGECKGHNYTTSDKDVSVPVFEIHDTSSSRSKGWDFTVYKSVQEALDALFFDMDAMENDEEIKIVFKRYTMAQMEEVEYER